MPLTEKEKTMLLDIARGAVERHLSTALAPLAPAPDDLTPGLSSPRGAFVTLHMDGNLRGCIGTFASDKPLCETISEMAISAATGDPRFPPVTRGEFSSSVHIEISALTPLKKIENTDEIEVGRHGIYMKCGVSRGVLLPQVATENGFDREAFLEQTCIKAGLDAQRWKREGINIYIFEAEIFSEIIN